MKTFILILSIFLHNSCGNGQLKDHSRFRGVSLFENEVTSQGPPPHEQIIAMARYVAHNTVWASVATISTIKSIEGFPFNNIASFVDGSLANSTGVPYFYLTPLDFTTKDLSKNSRTTVLLSLEETDYCKQQSYDPIDPRCTRLILSGKMKKVKDNSTEYNFAKAALFERHPAMANWPKDHIWFIAKLKIAQIAIIDYFGGAQFIPVKDYLSYKYTGMEILNYYNTRQKHQD